MFIMPRTCKSYIESKLLSEEEKEIFSKGISKEADDIIKKYMLDKNGKVAPTTTKESWLKYKPLLKDYLTIEERLFYLLTYVASEMMWISTSKELIEIALQLINK